MSWPNCVVETMARGLVFAIALVAAQAVTAQEHPLPWLDHLRVSGERREIHTIGTEAEVRVSDGLAYKATTLFHDRQRAVFRSEDAHGAVTLGIDGRYIWSYDGEAEREVGAAVEDFVLGHQIHAQLIFFDTLQDSLIEPVPGRFDGTDCLALSSAGESTWTVYYSDEGRPLGMEKHRPRESSIEFRLDSWREVDGLLLPEEVRIDDGERQFIYRYGTIWINRGSMARFRAPDSVLTEEQKLLRLHRLIMDDHFFGRTEAIKAMSADTVLVATGGEILKFPDTDWNVQVEQMMAGRDYFAYDDLVRPEVRISTDGTQGWVMVQVSAAGVRFGPRGQENSPLEFVCAWIELYEKIHGHWRMTGNVSNFRPEKQ